MRYLLLKVLVTIAMRLYFNRIRHTGLERIDNGRPTLILANHTNSYMDAIILGALLRRRIHIFTRGDVFEKERMGRFLRSINLLPVYRMAEGKDKLHRNDASNEEAMTILKGGGAVMIFAEGGSDIAKVLKPLKKGPFRLAAGAAAQLERPPVLAPLGINYTSPTRPFTNMYLTAGPVTDTSVYSNEDEGGQNKAALLLMRQVSADIRPLVWHVERPVLEPAADGLLRLQQEALGTPTFGQAQTLVDRLNGLDDAAAAALADQWQQFADLEQQLRPGALHRERDLAVKALVVLMGALPALAGWLFHFPPVRCSRLIADRKSPSTDFYAAIFLTAAIVLVWAWYVLLLIILPLIAGVKGLLVLLIAALCGVFYLRVYRRPLRAVLSYWRNRRAARRHPEAWRQLQARYGQLALYFNS